MRTSGLDAHGGQQIYCIIQKRVPCGSYESCSVHSARYGPLNLVHVGIQRNGPRSKAAKARARSDISPTRHPWRRLISQNVFGAYWPLPFLHYDATPKALPLQNTSTFSVLRLRPTDIISLCSSFETLRVLHERATSARPRRSPRNIGW